MSTRCTVHFENHGEDRAIVYRHSDGYPDGSTGVLASLESFFTDVQSQTNDTRFDDPSYLAAKFVVWQAAKYARRYNFDTNEYEPAPPLAFLSVGVVLKDPVDIEYRYHVKCNGGQPKVTYEEVEE